MSQIEPELLSLSSLSASADCIVTARPYQAEIVRRFPQILSKLSRAKSKRIPNYKVETVLRGGKDLKPGDLIHVGMANESFHEYMIEAQEEDLPMPYVSFPFYPSTAPKHPEDPRILFLVGTDVQAKIYNLHCEGSEENIDSLPAIKGYIGGH